MQNYWTNFDAILHTSYILVSDVTRHIFFSKISKNMETLHENHHFDALLHVDYILGWEVTPRIFFPKS